MPSRSRRPGCWYVRRGLTAEAFKAAVDIGHGADIPSGEALKFNSLNPSRPSLLAS